MITFTTVAPALPMRIKDGDGDWCFVLAIHSVFDDAMNDDHNPITSYATEYGFTYTSETLGTSVLHNGKWVDLNEF